MERGILEVTRAAGIVAAAALPLPSSERRCGGGVLWGWILGSGSRRVLHRWQQQAKEGDLERRAPGD